MEKWQVILFWATGIYLALCVIFYFIHEYFLFHPERLPLNFRYRYPFPFEEHHFDMEDGGRVNAIRFIVPNSKGVVFYFKGNTRSIKGWGKFAKDFVGKGYDFFVADYRGFGKSRGPRSENILYNDMQQLYRWLADQYGEERIVIYGRSMGSGFATRIASWNHPRMLILDCPYYSFIRQIARYANFLPIRWLLKYQMRTDLFIRKVQCPIFILHGRRDRLIPFGHSLLLQKLAPGITTVIPIEKAGHNNLPNFSDYHDFLYDILDDGILDGMPLPKAA